MIGAWPPRPRARAQGPRYCRARTPQAPAALEHGGAPRRREHTFILLVLLLLTAHHIYSHGHLFISCVKSQFPAFQAGEAQPAPVRHPGRRRPCSPATLSKDSYCTVPPAWRDAGWNTSTACSCFSSAGFYRHGYVLLLRWTSFPLFF